jgi:transcriptional regulator with XRE-family HTH domain
MAVTDTRRLGAELRSARRQARLSQQDLAKRAGISRRTLISIEQGQPTDTSKLFALLRALGAQLQLEPAPADSFGLDQFDKETDEL